MTAQPQPGEETRDDWAWGRDDDWSELAGRVTYPSRSQALALAVALARPVPGSIVEFGSWKGHSVRVIRDELWTASLWDRRQRKKRIYACDSFLGLPDAYDGLPKGNFATDVPKLRGVKIVEGFFEDSLTPHLAAEVGRISLAHLDADLYDSTLIALDWMTPLLGDGSLLLFDELAGTEPAEERALRTWSARTGVRVELLALFGREPSGRTSRADRRGLFQVVGQTRLTSPRPTWPTRLRRRIFAKT